jgi:hypothetical protein
MTANYKLDAIIEIRKYLWSQLSAIGIFNEEDYYSDSVRSTIVPIIPVQQSPEMNQFLSGKKHIVYDKINMSYEDNWAICNEQFLFTIYATDMSEINETRNFMVDLFRRMDESAMDIRQWDGVSDKFKFHTIYIADISATKPSEELKGFFSADVILEVKYSRITDAKGRFI